MCENEETDRREAGWSAGRFTGNIMEHQGAQGKSEGVAGEKLLLIPYKNHLLNQLYPYTASTHNTHTHDWDYKWRKGRCFSVPALNGNGGRSRGGRKTVSDKHKGKGLFELTHRFESSFFTMSCHPCPFPVFSRASAERKRWSRCLYKRCVHILNNLVCIENRIWICWWMLFKSNILMVSLVCGSHCCLSCLLGHKQPVECQVNPFSWLQYSPTQNTLITILAQDLYV